MGWCYHALRSSIGCKVIMSVSGLLLVGFLIGHLAGNLLVFAGPEAINGYAEGLRKFPALLWAARIGLLVFAVVHILSAMRLTQINRAAKPDKYQVSRQKRASLSSRTMGMSGLVVLAFVLYHLAHLTFRLTEPAFAGLGPYDAYSMMLMSFRSWWVTGFYVLAVGLLMVHLHHGIQSAFQSLGFNHSRYNTLIQCGSASLSVVLAAGFVSVPLAILVGIVG